MENLATRPATFDVGIVVTAMILHLALSVVYAFLIGAIVQRQAVWIGIANGGIVGLLLYFVNFYLFTEMFPWFAMARNWVSVAGHILFGAVAAWSYLVMARRSADT